VIEPIFAELEPTMRGVLDMPDDAVIAYWPDQRSACV
jgi:hypothetical protein